MLALKRGSWTSILALIGMLSLCFAAGPDAQTEAVSAHGSGVVAGVACDIGAVGFFEPCVDLGGKGLKFSFNFGGTIDQFGNGQISGTWRASEGDTGVEAQFVEGFALVNRNTHSLNVLGTCNFTTPTRGTALAPCTLSAEDKTSNGAVDTVTLRVSNENGSMFVLDDGELANGNVNIE
jgi:hypothetical protein